MILPILLEKRASICPSSFCGLCVLSVNHLEAKSTHQIGATDHHSHDGGDGQKPLGLCHLKWVYRNMEDMGPPPKT